jgi:hypothetical protein
LVVAKIWLQPGVGILSDLLHVYRRDVARQARLATLRTRRRMSEEAGVVKVRQVQVQGGRSLRKAPIMGSLQRGQGSEVRTRK